jgi:hypothetical protein
VTNIQEKISVENITKPLHRVFQNKNISREIKNNIFNSIVENNLLCEEEID